MKRNRAPRGGRWIGPKFYKGGQFLPAAGKVIGAVPEPEMVWTARAANSVAEPLRHGSVIDALSEAMIHQAEADLPPDVGYSTALVRVLRRQSRPSAKDLRTLDRRRRAAVALLADHPDSVVRQHFAGLLASYPNT